MNAQELRVGNLVTSKTWKGAHRISGIREKIDSFVVHINGFDHEFKEGVYCDIEPITLTEEWLVRFGFITRELGYYYLTDDLIINVDYQVYFETNSNSTHWLCECLYVHQLQNLYYALTGQELTLNDKP